MLAVVRCGAMWVCLSKDPQFTQDEHRVTEIMHPHRILQDDSTFQTALSKESSKP